MIKFKIDDLDHSYFKFNHDEFTLTIFQYCHKNNITIPCFCYHEKLSIAGNCRMCIVQVNNGLGVSCAINLGDDMFIYTDNKRIREARESILELLLINHPLDCPICDQGGECDLQDISLVFGSDRGRFYEEKKRAVDNFYQNGPLIKTIMTRCIHCTRCVRFSNEVSNFFLGVIGRGLSMEIGTYVSNKEVDLSLLDVLSGNIIDLCPVGALTSMPYAFKNRPWETLYYSNIDFLDSIAASIRLHIYSNKIIRILPLLDETLNEEWITNKTRFSYDAFLLNRISYPKIKYLNKFVVFSWDFTINYVLKMLNKNFIKSICCIMGPFIDLASTCSLKAFFNSFGSSFLISYLKINWIYDFKFMYLLNTNLENLEFIKFYLFISCDLRLENPILNLRIKKNYNINKNKELFLFSYGLSLKYSTYPIKNIGNSIFKFLRFLAGKPRIFCDFFFKSYISFSYINNKFYLYNKPIIFLGNSLISRADSKSFVNSFMYFLKNTFNWNSFNLIINNLGSLSYNTFIYDNISINKSVQFKGFLYNVSNEHLPFTLIKDYTFILYQGFLKSSKFLYNRCDVILPVTGPYEMDSLFLNLEGRYRFMKQIIKPFVGIFFDWEVLIACV